MYKFNKKQLPSNFRDIFRPNNSSKYNLRSSFKGNFILPKNTCKYVEHSLSYRGPKLWNTLHREIKNASSLNSFKSLFKIYLIYNQSFLFAIQVANKATLCLKMLVYKLYLIYKFVTIIVYQ